MRDPEIIANELVESSAIVGDSIKLQRIFAWCASHPGEVPFVPHRLPDRSDNPPPAS